MSEPLDEQLKKRISEVFDHYEEDASSAGDGWQQLRHKFPEQKQEKSTFAWWWRIAAAVLLLCVMSLWWINRGTNEQQKKIAKQHKLVKPDDNISNQITNITKNTQPSIAKSNNHAPVISKNDDVKIYPKSKDSLLDYPKIAQLKPVYAQTPSLQKNDLQQSIDIMTQSDTVILPQKETALAQVGRASALTDSISTKKGNKPATIEQLFADEKNSPVVTNNKPVVTPNKRVVYSLYAATFFNYAKGSNSQLNAGAGFTSDIKLFSNFKLSTGVSIARNSLNYDGQPVQANVLSAAISAANAGNGAVMAAPLNGPAFAATNLPAPTTVSGYGINLTGLDIPVNIKYEFNPQKTDTYIAAGLSSGTFINETFKYRYNPTSYALNIPPQSVPDASTSTGFSRFDFARTLNLSIGMGYQLNNKGNRLIIEPFLKYPLGGLGSQQIQFGAGGLNLKLKFSGK